MAFPGAVDHLGLRPVSAFGILLMPFTLVILPADLRGITANLLFGRNDTGCFRAPRSVSGMLRE